MKKVIGLLAILTVGFTVLQYSRDNVPTLEDFELDPSVERVVFRPAPSSLLSVAGGDWVDGRLYLLDPMRSEVVVLEEGEAGWTEAFAFGRKGEGPGELNRPMDALWLPDPEEVVVFDSDQKASFFTRDGTFLRVETLRLPCSLGRRSLTLRSPDDFWVAGNCAFPEPGNDTVFAVAAGRDGKGDWATAAKKPRFTLAGSYGSGFGLQSPVMGGLEGAFLSAGNDLCLARPSLAQDEARDEVCLEGDLFSSPVPEGFEPPPGRRGPLFSWPDPLPTISGGAVANGHLFILRMYSPDSLFVEAFPLDRLSQPGAKVAGGPWDDLVGCKSFGCIWYEPELTGNRIGILRLSDLLPPSENDTIADDSHGL